jgi:hypothetical protein
MKKTKELLMDIQNKEKQMAHNGLNGLTQTTTAVKWLEERFYFTKGQLIDIDFEQAKEMEKQQIETAYYDGKQNIPSMTEEEPKQLTAKEALLLMRNAPMTFVPNKRMYSEEDMAESFVACWKSNVPDGIECKVSFKEWFEQFKKQSNE